MNNQEMKTDEKYQRALERVKSLKSFYRHPFTVILINVFSIGVNLVTSPDNLWFYWVTFGTSIGLISHASKVFLNSEGLGFFGKDWEERKIKELMEKGI